MRFAALLGIGIVVGTFGCSSMKSAAAPAPEAKVAIAKEAPPETKTAAIEAEKKKAEDPNDLEGNMWGDSIDDSSGQQGLGLVGVGEGGGGRGEGIGLGSLGTLGHGAGTGSGQGYGSGAGRLGGSHSSARGRVSAATASTTGGGLPPEVIKRIVRQNFSAIQACYEKAMTKDPTLAGKVALRFTIDAQGAVSSAAVGDTTIADADMATCLVAVMRKMSFPAPENGGTMVVTYPLNFAPGDP